MYHSNGCTSDSHGVSLSGNGSYGMDDGYFRDLGEGAVYGAGDVITVLLNIDASTVTFRKNGASVGPPQAIAPLPIYYYFAFRAGYVGDAATIVDDRIQ